VVSPWHFWVLYKSVLLMEKVIQIEKLLPPSRCNLPFEAAGTAENRKKEGLSCSTFSEPALTLFPVSAMALQQPR
jgi:hypothetical protein